MNNRPRHRSVYATPCTSEDADCHLLSIDVPPGMSFTRECGDLSTSLRNAANTYSQFDQETLSLALYSLEVTKVRILACTWSAFDTHLPT